MVQVRQGTQADLAWVLQAAARSGWEQTVPRERPAAQWATVVPRTESLVRGALSLPGSNLLVAEAGGAPVGYAVYYLHANPLTGQPEGVLVDVYVEPPWRRRGAGRLLVAEAEDQVRRQGARALAVAASLYCPGALGLMTAMGYWPERVLVAKPLDL